MNFSIRLFAIVTIAASSLSFTSQAGAQVWIVGGSVGQAQVDTYDVGAALNLKNDDSDTSLSIFGGYLFNEWFGVLGTYIDFGDVNFAGTAYGGFTDKLSTTGFDASAYFMTRFGSSDQFTLFGSVGIVDFEQKVHYVDSFEIFDAKDTGTSTSYGIGIAYSFADSEWGIHGEYKMFSDIGDPSGSGHESDRTGLQFGIHRTFGNQDN